ALGVDPLRVAAGGDSAGGNLAAVVAQLARDAGDPGLVLQLLVYPVTNYDFSTASYRENGENYFLTTEMMRVFFGHYLRTEADGADPRVSPLRAKDLSGLPPALVITAGYDPLRDEGAEYAARLAEAGVEVVHLDFEEMIHPFFSMTGVLEQALEARQAAGLRLRAAFERARA
ncbi:MAG: alpha/beta hydrolase, partial [Acidobacteria bacterium]|nr:alpha/beta hydrolase [Acidobacteriota bacterium]